MNEALSMDQVFIKKLTDDPNNQDFADGIMEDILNNLFQVSRLRVISRTTWEHFLGSDLIAKVKLVYRVRG